MPDERTYIKVHDGMPDHPKIEPLSDAAFRLLITTWCWCSRHLTDGRLSEASWSKRGTAKARVELMRAGLAEEVEPGVIQMHDYLEHQRSAAQVIELKEKRRAAGSLGGTAKAKAVANAKQVLEQTASNSVPETETDKEELEEPSSSKPRKRGTRIDHDWKPTPADVEWQRTQGIGDFLARREHPKFIDYWLAKPGKDGTKLDWSATWRNWLRSAQEREPKPAQQRVVTEW